MSYPADQKIRVCHYPSSAINIQYNLTVFPYFGYNYFHFKNIKHINDTKTETRTITVMNFVKEEFYQKRKGETITNSQ